MITIRNTHSAISIFSILIFLCFFQQTANALTITADKNPLPLTNPDFMSIDEQTSLIEIVTNGPSSVSPQKDPSDLAPLPHPDTLITTHLNSTPVNLDTQLIIDDENMWFPCAEESQKCVLPTPTLVRYGANGVYSYTSARDIIDCTNETFGNPINTVKSCSYYLDIASSFDGNLIINNIDTPSSVTRESSDTGGGVTEHSAVASLTTTKGDDPLPEVDPNFSPLTQTFDSPGTLTLSDPAIDGTGTLIIHGNWIHCANEWQTCNLPAQALVIYGANDTYIFKTATDSIRCTNSAFGNPINIVKSCDYLLSDTNDFDNDGVADSADVFPSDPTESVDTDGDGFGDNSDPFPADNTNNADGNWVHCANEWRTCNLPAQALVRYGANGIYIFKTATDNIRCTNSAFGNPINIIKSCDYLFSDTNDFDGDGVADSVDAFPNDITESVDTDGDGFGDNSDPFSTDSTNNAGGDWVHCAYEWFTCNLPSQALVRYGANGVYVFQTATNSIRCTNSAFGNPINLIKSCDYLLSETSDFDGDGVADSVDAFPNDPTESVDTDSDGFGDNSDPFPTDSTNNVNGSWVHCANEWGTCSLPSSALVRYGANDVYAFQTVSGNISCTNTVFGNPINVLKSCSYIATVADDDNDSIANDIDNCPNDANTDQADIDNDNLGDVCDLINNKPTWDVFSWGEATWQ
jgi:predicted 2-oxoglutarate/Fe(II)-dependent dioxygenase YbiX